MKYKLTILITFITFFSSAQTIEWSPDTKLQRSDFQGKIPDDSINHAGTSYNIGYQVLPNSIWTGNMRIRTYALFNKSESWLKEPFYTDDLLNHEQKHFDIAQAFACKLQNLINHEIKNSNDFNLKFLNLNKTVGDDCVRYQKKYDAETDHGTIADVQIKYDKLISLLIKENCSRK